MNSLTDSDFIKNPVSPKPPAEEWWSSIFKPNFTFTECQQILQFETDDKSDSSLSFPSDDINSVTEFREIVKDIEQDKNLYRRVWRKDRLDNAVKKCMSENNLTNIEDLDTGYLCTDSTTQTDPCIWDSKELRIIRSCVKDFKHKNRKLEAQMKHFALKNEELSSKNKVLEIRLEKKINSLQEALKANERFHILTDTLSNQLDEMKIRIKDLLEQRNAGNDDRTDLQNAIQNLQKDIAEKDSEIKKQKRKLEHVDGRFKVILENSISSVKEKYQKEMDQLQHKLNEVTNAFQRESFLHRATEKGFQQLLNHFPESSSKSVPPDVKSIKYVHMP